ncbi:hypothetical protein EV212_102281 [Frisingicoccus caecimuris]|uniref:Uncharacterized protein n=1 Tax=Frisingicoccus caecimuris TaxID=1796636 RepID=A0A4R2LI70_9FIRM|nr:hypothetical protein EV212_102281 [Frisingicoccus caecimuris]
MSIRYLPLSGLLQLCFKGHTEGKILENDTEILHQICLIAYTAWKRGKEPENAENEQEVPVGAGVLLK